MIQLPTPGYLVRRLDSPIAWLATFCFYGILGGAIAGYPQGGLEAALLGSFVGGVVGSLVGLLFGTVVWLCYRLIGRWKRPAQGNSPAHDVTEQPAA
jgi:hypothetical protein